MVVLSRLLNPMSFLGTAHSPRRRSDLTWKLERPGLEIPLRQEFLDDGSHPLQLSSHQWHRPLIAVHSIKQEILEELNLGGIEPVSEKMIPVAIAVTHHDDICLNGSSCRLE